MKKFEGLTLTESKKSKVNCFKLTISCDVEDEGVVEEKVNWFPEEQIEDYMDILKFIKYLMNKKTHIESCNYSGLMEEMGYTEEQISGVEDELNYIAIKAQYETESENCDHRIVEFIYYDENGVMYNVEVE